MKTQDITQNSSYRYLTVVDGIVCINIMLFGRLIGQTDRINAFSLNIWVTKHGQSELFLIIHTHIEVTIWTQWVVFSHTYAYRGHYMDTVSCF